MVAYIQHSAILWNVFKTLGLDLGAAYKEKHTKDPLNHASGNPILKIGIFFAN